jgi:gamma-glutamyl-gamma-aminobutyrate hydrolase PuuD
MSEILLGFTTKPGLFYRRALREAGKNLGIDVHLCDLSEEEHIRWQRLDALILPGGPDIDPCYYMNIVDEGLRDHIRLNRSLCQSSKISKKRDAFEHGVLMELFHNRALSQLPVLGISRGMQMIAVSQGIPLYLDLRLETGIISSRFEYTTVYPLEGTRFYHMTAGKNFKALKGQHQGIRLPYLVSHKERWPNVLVSALSHDRKMVEAIEFLDRPVIGVQFHPELLLDEVCGKIFGWLLTEAQRRSEERRLILEREHTY